MPSSVSLKKDESAELLVNQRMTVGAQVQTETALGSLSKLLATVVIAILAYIMILLTVNIWFQYQNYWAAVQGALAERPINHAGILSYSRAWDFAVVKTSSLFLAFLLIFIGALYVLRSSDKEFALTVDGAKRSGTLQTSSPGLVMVALGVLLVTLVLFSKSVVSYTIPTGKGAAEVPISKLESIPNAPHEPKLTGKPKEVVP